MQIYFILYYYVSLSLFNYADLPEKKLEKVSVEPKKGKPLITLIG